MLYFLIDLYLESIIFFKKSESVQERKIAEKNIFTPKQPLEVYGHSFWRERIISAFLKKGSNHFYKLNALFPKFLL